jgi:hypothetical protein
LFEEILGEDRLLERQLIVNLERLAVRVPPDDAVILWFV